MTMASQKKRPYPFCVQKASDTSGQMTVEFVVVFPVLIIIAVIVVNALLFLSECAAFDRSARDAIRVHAASPAYGQTIEQSLARIDTTLHDRFNKDHLSSSVGVTGGVGGLTTFTATLMFKPTLFGLGLKESVFGVSLPALKHAVSLTVSVYRPGVLL